jgi:hypothetical protein
MSAGEGFGGNIRSRAAKISQSPADTGAEPSVPSYF